MQNISTENSAISEDAPPLGARHDDIQNESQAAKRAADETSAPVAPKGHKKKKKIKHVLRMEHQTLGRVRMKFSSAKGNPELLDEIGKKFAGIVGVESCEVNPITGSVVLHYDERRHDDFHDHLSRHCAERHGRATPRPPGTQLDEITRKIEDEAEFLAEHSHAAKSVVHICKYVDRRVKLATGNTIDLKIGLAGGIVALSLLEMGAFASTPVWLTLGVFSLNHFVELQQHHVLAEKLNAGARKGAKSAAAKSTPSA
jgi:Heavy metal associated domain 2